MLPIVENGLELTKQQFWDSIRLRYGWSIAYLPTTCACGSTYTIQHIFNINFAKLLSKVCHDVQVEPTLLPLTGEWMKHCSAIETNEARFDTRARGFWIREQ